MKVALSVEIFQVKAGAKKGKESMVKSVVKEVLGIQL